MTEPINTPPSRSVSMPELALVILAGPSGAGKSSFARQHFKPTEILSSDYCRGLVRDDENDQAATDDAFAVLNFIAEKRLAAGKLTVIDATNVSKSSRRPFIELARKYHCLPVILVFDLPARVCHERNRARPDRKFGTHVVRQQLGELRQSLRGLQREGFRHVTVFSSPEEVDGASIVRERLWSDRRDEHGPFDIIGDIHGCREELDALLDRLGYERDEMAGRRHPQGRRVVFLGDLVDRGPDIVGVLRLAMKMVTAGTALCVPGNHEMKLAKKLRGNDVRISHGLAQTLEQLAHEPPEFSKQVHDFIDKLISHYVLDDGKLVVAHAGMKSAMQGRGSAQVREFALYGETTGETDDFGLPVRYNWAEEYRGRAMVVYGHTPVQEAEWLNGTIDIDTGCVYGGALTSLRYPEKEIVSVRAARAYCESARPFAPAARPAPTLSVQKQADDLLDAEDVLGKRIVQTSLHRTVTIAEENSAAALEVMSRFAANPKWLIYLPPTMSPSETSREPGLLEHPAQAFAYYREEGISTVVCEEKHMGSRAVLIVCRDREAARRCFGIAENESGICYTRTGRRFFDDLELESALLEKVRQAVTRAGLWAELQTDWLCLDCELMPWSLKAQELLRTQYAAVATAAAVALRAATDALSLTAQRGIDVGELATHTSERAKLTARYAEAYRRYCWSVENVADLRLAPFHILAGQDHVYIDRDHTWHMQTLARLADGDVLIATPHRVVDLNDPAAVVSATHWWSDLVSRGGEGMVVKPFEFAARGRRGLVQPAVKCRGPEYLRIIYGPEYTMEQHLERLRSRGLSGKRSLALREFALGIEGLTRFVHGEPLRRVHECVFGVLALESEPVDPRL